ncbi:hypothetical protein LCGC14_1300000 [marine sediment metagenome]|uniref:ASCH domain-containing protein n=2 Tax=marine sediment metagenome TaxID=412755 RepID=A0A0F9N6I8_9ZZZZ
MPRNQSFFHTKKQYRARTKTVTRRDGWAFAKVGDIVNGCEKCQGLRKGEKIVVMGQHRYTNLRWEPLSRIIDEPEYGKAEVILEGFPDMTPDEFVSFFCGAMKCTPKKLVHRMEYVFVTRAEQIEFKYLWG